MSANNLLNIDITGLSPAATKTVSALIELLKASGNVSPSHPSALSLSEVVGQLRLLKA